MLLFLTFFAVLHSVFQPTEPDVNELRELLLKGSENKEQAKVLFEKVGNYEGNDPLLIGYKGAAFALKAKHGANPLNKLKNVKKAQALFATAVSAAPQNPEVRFLRYSVEAQTPASLNLSKHLTEDKDLLMQGLKNIPGSGFTAYTARIARDYLLKYCTCSEQEKEFLNGLKL